MLFILFLLTLVLLLGIGGLFAFVTAIYKDPYVVKGDTAMSNAKGEVVGTRVATHNLPLIVAPVLPDDELFSVETLRVTLPNSEFEEEDAVNSFRITRVEKVNSTVVIFYALGGEQIRVVNGDAAVRMRGGADDGADDIPVCEGNVTCAAFEVDSSTLAEKYIAEAEASLQTAGYTLEASLDSSAEVRQLRPKRRACRRYVYYLSRSRG